MEKETNNTKIFNMDALKANLPRKRGLSIFYSGKSRSFKSMADVHCLEDLKKQERPKKRKKHSDRQSMQVSTLSYRGVSTSSQCASPIVRV
ncbi:protein OXIDATIVE STRESS 3-like [Actinidia eriantha]|uniref:protein OXIDATIVE STRESS 3-like n=1 Tax=Actinidia eriantha TaxID=165200 RepID=UPI00258B800B|nr:protein OXIDATIVE STRESS 3-like [Actinidia eriantha]